LSYGVSRPVTIVTFDLARSPDLAWYRAFVAVGWFTVGLCILLALTDALRFSFHSTSGIQGWVTVNQYPKQQEAFWFLAAVAGIPAIIVAGWALWVAAAALVARLTGHPPCDVLKACAVWHLPLLIAWLRLSRLRVDAWELLLPATAAGLLLCVPSVRSVRFMVPRLRRSTAPGARSERAPSLTSSPEVGANNPAADIQAPSSRRRTGIPSVWRAASRLFVFAVVPIMLCLLLAHPANNSDVDLFHEGELLIPMDGMLRGGVPYRDYYLQHGLIHNALLPWLGAKIFGPTLAGLRAMTRFTEPLAYAAAYFFVLLTCRTRLLAAGFLGFLFCGSMIEIPGRAVFGLLSVSVLAAALAPPRSCGLLYAGQPGREPYPGLSPALRLCLLQGWPFLLAGALAMLAFWHSVEVGLYSLSTGALFLGAAGTFQAGIALWRRPVPLLLYGFGAAVVFSTVGAYLGALGAFSDMLRNVWIQCAYQTETWGLPFRNFFTVFGPILADPLHRQGPQALIGSGVKWYAAPIALTLAAAFLAFRATGAGFWRSRTAPQLLLTTLAGSFFFRTALGRSDRYHLHYGTLFALVLAIFLSDRLLAAAWDRLTARGVATRHRLTGLPWLAGGLISAVFLALFGNAAVQPLAGLERRWASLTERPSATARQTGTVPRGGTTKLSDRQAEYICAVVDYLREHTRPDEPVFDFSSTAGLLFFADRRPATRYFNVCYASLPALQQEVVRELERQRISLVIFRSGKHDNGFDDVAIEQRHPIIAAYLHDSYEPADSVGEVVFWRRRPDAAEPSP
jgi:hypothetical protein